MITFERASELLSYDENSGNLIWRVANSRRVSVGSIAGYSSKDSHISIRIDNKLYMSHRIIWLLKTGEMPVEGIDHRDCDKQNNRWSNLREATKTQNEHNTGPRKTNTSGFKGVSLHKSTKKWRATCGVNGKPKHLGCFETALEASKAYIKFALQHHGEFFHHV